jgi:putative transposase
VDLAATTQGKKITGRKRHVATDTLGLIWALVITPADVQDRDGGRLVLEQLRRHVRFPKVIWADGAYAALVSWALVRWLWVVQIVHRPRGRFEVQPKRWIVERTFGWLNRSRRLSKSYECTPESDAAFVYVAMIHLMVKRLTR